MLAGDVVGWLLSLVLAFAQHPLYPAYSSLGARPGGISALAGGISALADRQLAAGMMLGPRSLAATLYVFIGLYRWLGAHEAPEVVAGGNGLAERGAGTSLP